MKTELTN